MMLYRLSQIFLFILALLVLGVASFFLRCGETVMQRISSPHFQSSLPIGGIYTTEGISNLYELLDDEFDKLVDQLTSNTVYCQLGSIDGLSRIMSSDLLDPIGLKEGMELSREETTLLLERLDSYPWVQSYEVSTNVYPQRLSIKVKEAEPWFVAEYGGSSWLVSSKGILLDSLDTITNSKLIMEIGSLSRLYGLDKVDSEHTYLSSLNSRLKYVTRTLEFIDLAGGFPFSYDIIHLLPMGGILIEPNASDPCEKVYLKVHSLDEARDVLARYRATVEDISMRGEKAKEIDLRFASQVVVR